MLNELFKEVIPMKFADGEGYRVYTDKCTAQIAVTNTEIIMSTIWSFCKGGGSDMLNRLEKYAKSEGKTFVVSNIINPILRMMVEKRGYVKDYVPFSPEHGMMDLVEVYKKKEEIENVK